MRGRFSMPEGYVLGLQRCRGCGYEQISAWPVDARTEWMECPRCGEYEALQVGTAFVLPPDDRLNIECQLRRVVDDRAFRLARN